MPSNGNLEPRPIIEIRRLSKTYQPDCVACTVLNDVSFVIEPGEFVVLLGVSGSGKSTLINLIGGLDNPDEGEIIVAGADIARLNDTDRTLFRRANIGIVFQFFNLIPTLTVIENTTLPLELQGVNRRQASRRARLLLERVGLAHRSDDFPDKLSGGEQQRIAIARALVHEPPVVLADEPTGNLDERTGTTVLQMLLELTRSAGRTLLMATHNVDIVPLADRVFSIQDGKLIEPSPSQPANQALTMAVKSTVG